jgi:hypothetical protein
MDEFLLREYRDAKEQFNKAIDEDDFIKRELWHIRMYTLYQVIGEYLKENLGDNYDELMRIRQLEMKTIMRITE